MQVIGFEEVTGNTAVNAPINNDGLETNKSQLGTLQDMSIKDDKLTPRFTINQYDIDYIDAVTQSSIREKEVIDIEKNSRMAKTASLKLVCTPG